MKVVSAVALSLRQTENDCGDRARRRKFILADATMMWQLAGAYIEVGVGVRATKLDAGLCSENSRSSRSTRACKISRRTEAQHSSQAKGMRGSYPAQTISNRIITRELVKSSR